MSKDMYLTDKQYETLLLKMHEAVHQPDFILRAHDSTESGNKYTETNIGLCNEEFTTKDMALFPEDFPGRKSMKYRLKNHRCPFDMEERDDHSMGCFYTCAIFKGRKLKPSRIIELVDKMVVERKLITLDS